MSQVSIHSRRWRTIRQRVLDRDHHECQLRIHGVCRGRATTADHVVPRALGGDESMTNLVAACGPCNSSKGDGRRGAAKVARSWSPRITPAAVSSSLPPRARTGTVSTVHYQEGPPHGRT